MLKLSRQGGQGRPVNPVSVKGNKRLSKRILNGVFQRLAGLERHSIACLDLYSWVDTGLSKAAPILMKIDRPLDFSTHHRLIIGIT